MREDANRVKVGRSPQTADAERLAGLRDLYPEAFAEGKVDFDKLRGLLGSEGDERAERYNFTWAGKRDAIRLLQMPSRAALVPCPEDSIGFETSRNVFIEGENLEVLKLLYKSYFGRVKMIYIDPPYNTGNDFIYPDDYADSLATYLRFTRQQDSAGNLLTSNPETSGRYHSAWLSMMYPRLFLARQLLRQDGVIFVSIDDHEVHNLRLILNELYGEESFLACFIWHRRQMADSRNQDRSSTDHEYVLAYGKGEATLRGKDIDVDKYSNPDDDPRGPWFSADITGLATKERRPNLHYDVANPESGTVYHPSPTRGWSVSRETFQRLIGERRILWPAAPQGRPRRKKFLNEATSLVTGLSTMLDVGFTTEGTREIQDLFGEKVIQFPKPVSLLKTLVEQTTANADVVLDFFAGSCTTAHALLELNREDRGDRRFIMVQLPEPTGNRQWPTIAEIGKERIRRVLARMRSENADQLSLPSSVELEDLGFRVFKMMSSAFRSWDGEAPESEAYARQLELQIDPLTEGWNPQDVIWEVALREGFGLDAQVVSVAGLEAEAVWHVSDPAKEQSFFLCLANCIELAALRPLNLGKEDLFICRDAALDDEAAANLALQCRLKTI